MNLKNGKHHCEQSLSRFQELPMTSAMANQQELLKWKFVDCSRDAANIMYSTEAIEYETVGSIKWPLKQEPRHHFCPGRRTHLPPD